MSLYHSVTVNPDNSDNEPVFVEISNIEWKNDYYRRERRKRLLYFLITVTVISGCFAFFWSHKSQLKFRDPFIARCNKPRIVGYYTGKGNRIISENQLSKLTHVIFSFLVLNSNGSISFRNENEEERFLDLKEKVNSGKNSGVKLMFSIDENGVNFHFSKVSENARKRKTFIDSISSFIDKHQLDGVDLNWRYPYREDLENQVKLIKELREDLVRLQIETGRRAPFLISIVAPSLGRTLKNEIGENLEEILEYVNFVNVQSFDYSPYWMEHTGSFSPLYSGNSGNGDLKKPSVNDTFSYYLQKAESPKQLNLGLGFHGIYWRNVKGQLEDDIWRSVETKKGYVEKGQVLWRNIKLEAWSKLPVSWLQESRAPYIWDSKNQILLSFENESSLKEKINYAIGKNLGGLTIWSLEMNDDVDTLLGAVTSLKEWCSED